MKATEIITNPPGDEYIDCHNYAFDDAEVVATMKKRFVVWYGPDTTTENYFNF